MPIKLIVGLGNSGDRYVRTRHNAGANMLYAFARSVGADFKYEKFCGANLARALVGSDTIWLCTLCGFMNESGINLASVLRFLKTDISSCAVCYDDINIALGRMKLSLGGSAGGHNGVKNILERCSDGFARLRIGVGGRADKRQDLADYVLGVMNPEQMELMHSLDGAFAEAVKLLVCKGVPAAQNIVNRKADAPSNGASKAEG